MANWRSLSVCALLALMDTTAATTAPNFPISGGSVDLDVSFANNTVSPPGELIPRGDTANPPTIKTPTWTTSSNGIIMMVDTDVPRNGNRVQLLHWLVSGVTLSQSDNSTLIIPSEAEASYRQPSPPVGDSPHAYTILLFPQPDDFDVPSQFQDVLQTRVFFDAKGFADAAGFGEPVAANYIRVQNTSGTPTQSFPPAAGSATATGVGTGGNGSNTSVPAPFPGGAAGLGDRAWVAGIGTAVVAGLMGFFL